MAAGATIVLQEREGGVSVVLVEGDRAEPVGPLLGTGALGVEGCALARAVFAVEGDRVLDAAAVAELLARAEQLALDGLYAGPASAREAARARVVVAWAALVIEALAQRAGASGESGRRLDRLIALSGGDGVDSLRLADLPPAVTPDELAVLRRERGLARQVRAHLRHRRAMHRERRPSDRAADDAVREIALQPFRNRWAIFSEIGAGIAFTTFASAGSFVFLGTRLQKCTGPCSAGGINGFAASLDIIALVICSFGFLFATLSYANATGVLARLSTMGYDEALERGNRVSEYFGVYPLVFAIPLAVEQSTSAPIPLIVKLIGLVAFLGYHAAHQFSLIERVIGDDALGSDRLRRATIAGMLALLAVVWFAPSAIDGYLGLWLRVAASGLFLLAIVAIYGLASIVPEQGHPQRFHVHRSDLLSDESPSLYDLRPPAGR